MKKSKHTEELVAPITAWITWAGHVKPYTCTIHIKKPEFLVSDYEDGFYAKSILTTVDVCTFVIEKLGGLKIDFEKYKTPKSRCIQTTLYFAID